MRCRATRLVLLSVLLTLGGMASGLGNVAVAEEFHFRFNPPDSLRTTMRTEKKVKKGRARSTKSEWEHNVERSDSRIFLKSRPRYDRSFLPSWLEKEDWESVPDKRYITSEIDSCGNLLSISGYGDFMAQVRELRNEEFWDPLQNDGYERNYVRRTRWEWAEIIPRLACRTFSTGDIIAGLDSASFVSRETLSCDAAVFTVLKIGKRIRCDYGDCVRVQFWQSTDPHKLREIGGTVFDEFYKGDVRLAYHLSKCSVELESHGEVWVSVSTTMVAGGKSKEWTRWEVGRRRDTGKPIYRILQREHRKWVAIEK